MRNLYKYIKATAADILFFVVQKIILGEKVSILMYHSVGNNNQSFNVTPEKFEWQMKYLKDKKYNVVSLETLSRLLSSDLGLPSKTVCLTFDDGYEDNYSKAFPILKKFNFPATIFVITGLIGGERVNKKGVKLKILDWNQIKEMELSGLIDIEPHTKSHIRLTYLDSEKIRSELEESTKTLEEKLNKKCKFFAYPFGAASKKEESIVGDSFKLAVGVNRGFVDKKSLHGHLTRNTVDSIVDKFRFRFKI